MVRGSSWLTGEAIGEQGKLLMVRGSSWLTGEALGEQW